VPSPCSRRPGVSSRNRLATVIVSCSGQPISGKRAGSEHVMAQEEPLKPSPPQPPREPGSAHSIALAEPFDANDRIGDLHRHSVSPSWREGQRSQTTPRTKRDVLPISIFVTVMGVIIHGVLTSATTDIVKAAAVVGGPTFALVVGSILLPRGIPPNLYTCVMLVSIFMLCTRLRTIQTNWMALAGEPDLTQVAYRRFFLGASAVGSMLRTMASGISGGRYFWEAARALSCFNGLLIFGGIVVLSQLEGNTTFFPGRSSLRTSLIIGGIFVLDGVLFTEAFRINLARRAGVAGGVGGVVYRPVVMRSSPV
jgi:hypothetical protein